MRLVLDTNVVVSALLWEGVPNRLLRVSHSEGILLYTSTPLLKELIATLSKSKLEKKIDASLYSIDQLVDLYAKEWGDPTALPEVAVAV
jgi:putative PIN family toxin of toxin-antitoxin system